MYSVVFRKNVDGAWDTQTEGTGRDVLTRAQGLARTAETSKAGTILHLCP